MVPIEVSTNCTQHPHVTSAPPSHGVTQSGNPKYATSLRSIAVQSGVSKKGSVPKGAHLPQIPYWLSSLETLSDCYHAQLRSRQSGVIARPRHP